MIISLKPTRYSITQNPLTTLFHLDCVECPKIQKYEKYSFLKAIKIFKKYFTSGANLEVAIKLFPESRVPNLDLEVEITEKALGLYIQLKGFQLNWKQNFKLAPLIVKAKRSLNCQWHKSTKPESNPQSRKGSSFSFVFSTTLRMTSFLSKKKKIHHWELKRNNFYFQ